MKTIKIYSSFSGKIVARVPADKSRRTSYEENMLLRAEAGEAEDRAFDSYLLNLYESV